MDRYQNLDLDLECDGESGAVPQKSVLFKGMFKKSLNKSGEQPVQTEESLFTDSELSKSEESLNDSKNTKNKWGLIKGMFKKTTKTSKEDQPQDKSGVTLKQTSKGECVRRSSEDLLDNKFSVSKDSPLQNNNTKESGGGFGGVIKKLSKPFGGRTRSQDNLSEPSELSGSNDDLSTHDNTEEVKSKMIQQETKERHEPPPVPPKPTTEEIKNIAVYDKVKQRQAEDNQQSQTDDEGLKEEEDELKSPVRKTKAVSDDRRAEQQKSSSKEERKEEAAKEKPEKAKVMKLKKQNPFMPQVKAKLIQRGTKTEPTGDRAESEGGNRSLLDQLDNLRIEPPKPEDSQDVDLMEWWNTVESWEDMPNDEDMTEKEEAKAFAVTADKVQKGIRVFNKLFSERAESLWQHVMDLNSIADALDKFNKNTKIAQITGGSTSAIGGVATIAGLALAPFTMGTSLIVTAVGLGVATAGSLTSAGAGISNQVNNSMDRKKVEKIVEDYQEKILDLNKCLKFIQQGIENLRKFDLIKMKQHAYNQDFPVLTSSLYEDGAMAGKAILTNANEIMRVVQIAHMAGSTAARAVQVASMATGVLTGLFIGMDIYFVAKDSKELKKGAKSEFAGKIRQVVTQLHDGLVELNGIRVELQASAQADTNKARKDNDYRKDDDDDEEDEIDRIKKAIKKDIESREYV